MMLRRRKKSLKNSLPKKSAREQAGENLPEISINFEIVAEDEVQYDPRLRDLGQGAYGTVVMGIFRGQKVAIKKMNRQEKCIEEARRLSKLDHPNVVKLHAYFENLESRVFCLILEFMHISMDKVIFNPDFKYYIDNVMIWAEQVASALKAMHAINLIHRDVKPENILLNENFSMAKICDFGNSGFLKTSMTAHPGTIRYMAPEAFFRKYSQLSDVFSFGITVHTMISRSIPDPEINNEVAFIYNRCQDNYKLLCGDYGQVLKPILRLLRRCVKPKPEKRPNMIQVHKKIINLNERLVFKWRPIINVKDFLNKPLFEKTENMTYDGIPAPKRPQDVIGRLELSISPISRLLFLSRSFDRNLRRLTGTYSSSSSDQLKKKFNKGLILLVIGWITWFQVQFCIQGVLLAYQSEWINSAKVFTDDPHAAIVRFMSWRFYSAMFGSIFVTTLHRINPVYLLRITACLFIGVGMMYWLAFNQFLWLSEFWLVASQVLLGLGIAFGRSVSVTCIVELLGYESFVESLIIFGEVGECLSLAISTGSHEKYWLDWQLVVLFSSFVPIFLTYLPQFNKPFKPRFLAPSTSFYGLWKQIFSRNFTFRIILTSWIYSLSFVGINFWMFSVSEESTLRRRGITEKVWYAATFSSNIVSILMTMTFHAVEPWRGIVFCSAMCSVLYVFSSEVFLPLPNAFYIFVIISTVSTSEASLAPLIANLHKLMRKSELSVGWPLTIFGYYAFNEGLRAIQSALPLWQILVFLVFLQIFFTFSVYLIFNTQWLSSLLVRKYA